MKKRVLVSVGLASLASTATTAQTLSAVDRGWYGLAGNHTPSNLNYFAGQCGTCGSPGDTRNFFVFDLSSITDPIIAATLSLDTGDVVQASADETYVLHDMSTDPADLIDGTGGVAAWTDMGTGTQYASLDFDLSTANQFLSIPLNAAALDDMNAASGLFAIGGVVTSLVGNLDASIFGFTTADNVVNLTVETEAAECFLVIGDGTSLTPFGPSMHEWFTQTGSVEDFYLVALDDFPKWKLSFASGVSGNAGALQRAPSGGSSADTSSTSSGGIGWKLGPQDSTGASKGVPGWMADGQFTVQVVMWNPGAFPGQPEQVSHGLAVRIEPDGTVLSLPYGAGTGMLVWAETETTPEGETLLGFPFLIPGM